MKVKRKSRLQVKDYINGILAGDRILLSRAITLIESNLTSDRKLADAIIEQLLPRTGNSIRIGITGTPGVGKSTFIETFGKFLTAQNKKIAVLTVDPSSEKTKGSILGDKTRMDELAKDTSAFIRPSPSRQSLGGVTDSTHETILLCEAAGYEIIIVETVGVGQSETAVRSVTDFFLLLIQPGAGDELQGIKKGIMEMADGIAITKSDGENLKKAKEAQADLYHALHLFHPPISGFNTTVTLTSSVEKKGFSNIWKQIESFKEMTFDNDYFFRQRKDQDLNWFHSRIETQIKNRITQKIKKQIASLDKKIIEAKITSGKAAKAILKKIKIVITLMLFAISFSFAQNLSPQARVTPNLNDLFNGMPFARSAPNVVGDVYIDSHWAMTSIELIDDKKIEWYWTRYDLRSDELEIKTPAGTKIMSSNRIKEFYVKDTTGANRKFINATSFKKEGVPLNGILEMLAEGTRPLFKQFRLDIQRPNYNPALNSGTRDSKIIKSSDYYYSIDGELIKIPNAKKFIASLGEHSNPVNNYIRKNHLSMKEEKDLNLIFSFYNSLLTP
jgi:LAO/AO transport system kinase